MTPKNKTNMATSQSPSDTKLIFFLKGERMSKKNLVLNESKYDEGHLCEI